MVVCGGVWWGVVGCGGGVVVCGGVWRCVVVRGGVEADVLVYVWDLYIYTPTFLLNFNSSNCTVGLLVLNKNFVIPF